MATDQVENPPKRIIHKGPISRFSFLIAILNGAIDCFVLFGWLEKTLCSLVFGDKKMTSFVKGQNQCKLILYAFPFCLVPAAS